MNSNEYLLKITCPSYYKEIELPDKQSEYTIGTSAECDFRIDQSRFLVPFKLIMDYTGTTWRIMSSEEVYLRTGASSKLIVLEMAHGDTCEVCDRLTDSVVIRLELSKNFQFSTKIFLDYFVIDRDKSLSISTERFKSDIIITSDYSSDERIELKPRGSGFELAAIHTKLGITVNGIPAKVGQAVTDTDFIGIAEVMFYLNGDRLYYNSKDHILGTVFTSVHDRESMSALEYPHFNKNSRVKVETNKEPIEILDPPTAPVKPKRNIILQLLPALGMLAIIIVVRGLMSNASNNMAFLIFSVASMTMGIFTTIVSFIQGKKDYKQEVIDREEKYNKYIEEKKETIREIREKEIEVLEDIYYSPEVEIELVRDFDGRLFERDYLDDDFMKVRIGIGERDAIRPIQFKKKERFSSDDPLVDIPEKVYEECKNLREAPITIDFLNDNAVGVVGTSRQGYQVLKLMVLDLTARHHFDDLELLLMISEEEHELYNWARWYPHLFNDGMGVRNIIWDVESRDVLLEYLYTTIIDRMGMIKGNNDPKNKEVFSYGKQIVVLVKEDWNIASHPIAKYFDIASKLGITFVFFKDKKELLPKGCDEILVIKDEQSAELMDSERGNKSKTVRYSSVGDEAMDLVGRKLTPIFSDEISLENSLPKSYSFFEMLHIFSVEDVDFSARWNAADVERSMAAPIGIKRGNEIQLLDLHEKADGPHGLVAGTTGSGKSELLQTYILSMATLYHPYEVGFVIIDFKGGGMANQFQELPHLMGTITNIDGREINRSLQSIKAELQKRQRLFAEHNVNNINAYIHLYKNGQTKIPLPHLIIIVDEFAELKADQPEFMKELISASRIGRSLGVHLILATQKPAGQVNEQIWSNSRFKLCLKVQTIEDSNEVIKSPLAAEIKEAGRAYFQVGNNEVFELFQSAYSGASISEGYKDETQEFDISRILLGGKRELVYSKHYVSDQELPSQLNVLIDAVSKYCEKNGIEKLSNICLPPLSDWIDYPEAPLTSDIIDFQIGIGIYDDPTNQYQGNAVVDLANDSAVIIGATQMGKSNLLQLLLRSISAAYTPREVNVYIIDFASMTMKVFEELPHVGGVVIPGENEKLKNLFKLLREEIDYRKEKILEVGVSSFSAYLEAQHDSMPRIVVMLDNFSSFKEMYEDAYDADFQYLTREGPTYGISFVVTNTRTAGFGYRYLANFGTRIAFTCMDSGEYSTLFERNRLAPKEVQGRALCRQKNDVYETQTYLAFSGEKEHERSHAIREFVHEMKMRYPDESAKPIPEIPDILTVEYIKSNYRIKKTPYVYAVGLNYSTVDVVKVDFNSLLETVVVGSRLENRMDIVNGLLSSIHEEIFECPVRVSILDNYERSLKKWSEFPYVSEYTIDANAVGGFLDECSDELDRRTELMKNGEAVNYPLHLYVINSRSAIDVLSESQNLMSTYTNIIKKGRSLRVMFVFSDIDNMTVGYSSPALLKHFRDNRKAFLADKLEDVKFFDISLSSIRENKGNRPGDVYLLNGNDVSRIRMISSERK